MMEMVSFEDRYVLRRFRIEEQATIRPSPGGAKITPESEYMGCLGEARDARFWNQHRGYASPQIQVATRNQGVPKVESFLYGLLSGH